MKKQVLFLQGGGGEEDYEADRKMVIALQAELGKDYTIDYPLLVNEEAPDFGRVKQIAFEISKREDELILVAHSLGASMLLKYLSENKITKSIGGIFLLAAPFWSGKEDWKQPLKLQPGFDNKLDKSIPLFFYQCRDDEEIPLKQFESYKGKLPWARFREFVSGGHQFDKRIPEVADDILMTMNKGKGKV